MVCQKDLLQVIARKVNNLNTKNHFYFWITTYADEQFRSAYHEYYEFNEYNCNNLSGWIFAYKSDCIFEAVMADGL